ncbi:MAG: hypothetical protein WDW38_006425 [Sanguina aurantia]
MSVCGRMCGGVEVHSASPPRRTHPASDHDPRMDAKRGKLFGTAFSKCDVYRSMMSVDAARAILRHGQNLSPAGTVFSGSLHNATDLVCVRKHYDGYVPSNSMILVRTHEFSSHRTVFFPDDAAMDAEVERAWGPDKVTEVRRREASLPTSNRKDFETTCEEIGMVGAGHCHLHDELIETALRVRHPGLMGMGLFGEVVFTLGIGIHSVEEVLGFVRSLQQGAHRPVAWEEVELFCVGGHGEQVGSHVRRLVLADVRDVLGYDRIQALWASVRHLQRQDVLDELRRCHLTGLAERLEQL